VWWVNKTDTESFASMGIALEDLIPGLQIFVFVFLHPWFFFLRGMSLGFNAFCKNPIEFNWTFWWKIETSWRPSLLQTAWVRLLPQHLNSCTYLGEKQEWPPDSELLTKPSIYLHSTHIYFEGFPQRTGSVSPLVNWNKVWFTKSYHCKPKLWYQITWCLIKIISLCFWALVWLSNFIFISNRLIWKVSEIGYHLMK
jgi:hypothetical protein